jgi:hypothetical protein
LSNTIEAERSGHMFEHAGTRDCANTAQLYN